MIVWWCVGGLLLGLLLGGGGLLVSLRILGNNALARARAEGEQVKANAIAQSQNKAKEIELAARQAELARKQEFERSVEAARQEMKNNEHRLAKREDNLDRKLDTLTVKERHLDELESKLQQRDKAVGAKEEQLDQVLHQQRDRLLQITGMSVDAAKEMLLKRLEDECKAECGKIVLRATEQAQEEAKEKSRQIILQAIQRYAAQQTADHTVSTVTIPTDDMKGRVIGREGRNIRSFEKATGVDVIIDDTPGVVVVSCFDPVRREIARISLERLVQDGRIHPARIEEVVALTTKEMEEELIRIGSGPGGESAESGQADHSDAGAAGVSDQLRPKRAAAQHRSGLPVADHRG